MRCRLWFDVPDFRFKPLGECCPIGSSLKWLIFITFKSLKWLKIRLINCVNDKIQKFGVVDSKKCFISQFNDTASIKRNHYKCYLSLISI